MDHEGVSRAGSLRQCTGTGSESVYFTIWPIIVLINASCLHSLSHQASILFFREINKSTLYRSWKKESKVPNLPCLPGSVYRYWKSMFPEYIQVSMRNISISGVANNTFDDWVWCLQNIYNVSSSNSSIYQKLNNCTAPHNLSFSWLLLIKFMF